jgi:hypothetical protein
MAGPTPYPDVNAVLHELLSGVRASLGRRFIGLYLTGSLADGDFNPLTSDIDFLIITDEAVSDEELATLSVMHARLRASGAKWATHIEGVYVSRAALQRYDPAQSRYPHLGADGHFGVEAHGGESVIQRYSLREHGVSVAGPDPRAFVDPIKADELRAATMSLLREWWAPMLDHNPTFLHSAEYQAYAVLTMCRMLYTFKHGTIVSKPFAARWGLTALEKQWTTLIEWALAWRPGIQINHVDHLSRTLDFIRYVLDELLGDSPLTNTQPLRANG